MIEARFRRFALALFLTCALVTPFGAGAARQKKGQAARPASASARGNSDHISASKMKEYLTFIASDELEGRDTPSSGLDKAADYIAGHLKRWGLKPAGDGGTYFQRIALRRQKVVPAQSRAEVDGQRFSYGEDFIAAPTSTQAPPVVGTASGPLVYVGHGWVFNSKKVDPYRGVDVKDKIVIISDTGLPEGVTLADMSGKQGGDWDSPRRSAQKRGAKGAIIIASSRTLDNWDSIKQASVETGTVAVEAFQGPDNPPLPAITASPPMVAALFKGEGQNAETYFEREAAGEPAEPFELKRDKKVSFTVGTATTQAWTHNVIAVVEGGDPALKNEYVAIGAHYDHVGVGEPVNGDAIYNGADDNGSGTVAVMAMAEAFAVGPRPKRSILLVWHTGEERGLWGSRYITERPPVPLRQIIAQLNIDMIGRSKKEGDLKLANRNLVRENEVYVVGSKMMSTELGELSESVNKSYLNLAFNYKYDDPKDPEQFFYRSDHYNYARKGVPVIFYFTGEHEDYHKPSDSIDRIDFGQLEKVARTIYATARELANIAKRPRVDKNIPE